MNTKSDPVDTTTLRALAEKASSARWCVDCSGPYTIEGQTEWNGYSGWDVDDAIGGFVARLMDREDADFVAAANPATMIALCDEMDRLRVRIAELEAT